MRASLRLGAVVAGEGQSRDRISNPEHLSRPQSLSDSFVEPRMAQKGRESESRWAGTQQGSVSEDLLPRTSLSLPDQLHLDKCCARLGATSFATATPRSLQHEANLHGLPALMRLCWRILAAAGGAEGAHEAQDLIRFT